MFIQGGYWGKVEVSVNVSDFASGRYDVNHLYLDGWLDFGHNGAFGDQSGVAVFGPAAGTSWSEHIVSAVLDPKTWSNGSGSDSVKLTYTFVNGEGPSGPFYARFRLNYGEGANTPTGAYNTGSIQDFGDIKHGSPGQDTPEPPTALLLFGGLFGAWVSRRIARPV